MSYLDEIDDPRKPSNGTLQRLPEILVILIAAVLDRDTVEDITFWARTKEAWLRRFLVLKNGIPSEETFLRILRALDPKQFENMFRCWVGGVVGALSDDAGLAGTIAIDGKTVRGSGTGGESAIPWSAPLPPSWDWCSARRRSPPRATRSPRFRSAGGALDQGVAGHDRRHGLPENIAKQIVAKKGDYLLMVKGNQPKLLEAIEIAFIDQHGVESVDRSALVERGPRPHRRQIASVLSARASSIRATGQSASRSGASTPCGWSATRSPIWSGATTSARAPLRRATGCRGASALGRGEPASLDLDVSFSEDASTVAMTMRRRTCRCCARSRSTSSAPTRPTRARAAFGSWPAQRGGVG